jgi:hypothetical protein
MAFYRVEREAEVAGIGGVAAVNGILNGAVTGVKEGRKCGRVKGGGVMRGLTGRVLSMAQRRVRRRWHSAGTCEGGRGRPVGPAGCWADWART